MNTANSAHRTAYSAKSATRSILRDNEDEPVCCIKRGERRRQAEGIASNSGKMVIDKAQVKSDIHKVRRNWTHAVCNALPHTMRTPTYPEMMQPNP